MDCWRAAPLAQDGEKGIMDGGVPEYHLSRAKPCPVLGLYKGIIESWFKDDKGQPKKQRHTAHRIYERLVGEYGFAGGERTVRHYVRKLKLDIGELAIPLEFDPGSDAQCDWGEAPVYMGNEMVPVQVFCMKLCYSGKPLLMAFPTPLPFVPGITPVVLVLKRTGSTIILIRSNFPPID